MKIFLKPFLFILPVLFLSLVACNEKTEPPKRTLVIKRDSSNPLESSPDALKNKAHIAYRGFLSYFKSESGYSRIQFFYLVTKYYPFFEREFGVKSISVDQVVNSVFFFDTDEDAVISLTELRSAFLKLIPSLNWLAFSGELNYDQLLLRIKTHFSLASEVVQKQLADEVMSADHQLLGGDGNNLLSHSEIMSSGIVMGYLSSEDINSLIYYIFGESKGLERQYFLRDAKTKILKIGADEFIGRTEVKTIESIDFSKLGNDRVLAFQLIVRYGLIQKARFLNRASMEIEDFYISDRRRIRKRLLGLYDLKVYCGDENKEWSAYEILSASVDQELGAKIFGRFPNSLKLSNAVRSYGPLLDYLSEVFLLVGENIFYVSRNPTYDLTRKVFWDSISEFDLRVHGGNKNGKLEPSEFSNAITYLSLVESLYYTYDTNLDNQLTRAESFDLFNNFGLSDRETRGFYADIGLDGKQVGFIEGSIGFKISEWQVGDSLAPFGFYTRLVKVLKLKLK